MRPSGALGAAAAAPAISDALYKALQARQTLVAGTAAETARVSVEIPTPASTSPAAAPLAASSGAGASSTEPMPVALGTVVRLTGLQSKPELNGQRGRVIGWDAVKGRLNVAIRGGKTLQVKPSNIVEADPSEERIEDMDSDDLIKITLQRHEAFTTAHAARAIGLLKVSQTPVEAGNLLRCCCASEWLVTGLQDPKSKETKVEPFQHVSLGAGLLLSTSTERCVQLSSVAPAAPSGSMRVAVKVAGRSLFGPTSLEALIKDGVKFVGLDGQPATSGSVIEENGEGSFTVLGESHFPSLMHMSAALALEASLTAIRTALPQLRTSPTDHSQAAEALRAFAQHTFFCFNASTDPNSILPITSMHEGDSFMLLYTCEMVLEAARVVLDDLGAFKSMGTRVPSGPLPASYLIGALTGPVSNNAGIHINEFVPGMSEDYKMVGLKTAELEMIMRAGAEGSVV